jgi:hypothetical protein
MTGTDRLSLPWSAADEMHHAPDGRPGWREEWAFWFWSVDGLTGGYTGLTLVAGGTWYWAALIRPGQPLLHVCDLGGPPLRPKSSSLLLKAEGLWADHDCEVPFEQWTVTNECYAVALDDPDEVFARAYGVATPIAFDLEWYATDTPREVEGGYEQVGAVHAVIELAGGPLHAEFLGYRTHRWGRWSWGSDELADGARAPLFVDGVRVERRLTARGWSETALRP